MNVLRGTMKGFFSYLHTAGHISENPTRLTRRALCGNPPPNGLSPVEQDRLLHALSGAEDTEGRRDHALFHLMLTTGLRLSSAIALDRDDVDLGRAEIEVRSAKGNRPDRVFLGAAILKHLTEYMGDRRSGPLFASRGGRRMSHRQAQRRFSEWLGKAGITRRASPHSARHAFALGLYQRTGDIFASKQTARQTTLPGLT